MAEKAIVIGASSGIGRALAKVLAREGYIVGVCGRRVAVLEELGRELQGASFVRQLDVVRLPEAMDQLRSLIDEMGGADLIILCSGTGAINSPLRWSREDETIGVNVRGFAAMANVAMHYFREQGAGHLVGISSVAAVRGSGYCPAYSASKAFESNYLEGLRHNIAKSGLSIAVTDVQPGFVDTAMAKGDRLFWVASAEKTAEQIFRAIRKKKAHVYTTRRWRLIAWGLRILPDFFYHRM